MFKAIGNLRAFIYSIIPFPTCKWHRHRRVQEAKRRAPRAPADVNPSLQRIVDYSTAREEEDHHHHHHEDGK